MDTQTDLIDSQKIVPASRPNPAALKVIAGFDILSGLIAIIDISVSLTYGRIYPDLSVLGLYSGPGLLNRSQGWRNWALFCTCIGLLFCPAVAIWMYASPTPLTFTFLGIKVAYASKQIGFIILACAIVLKAWEFRILTSHEVRVLFGLSTPSTESPASQPRWGSFQACIFIVGLWILCWGLALYSAIQSGRLPVRI